MKLHLSVEGFNFHLRVDRVAVEQKYPQIHNVSSVSCHGVTGIIYIYDQAGRLSTRAVAVRRENPLYPSIFHED